jgi:hypothetical protein
MNNQLFSKTNVLLCQGIALAALLFSLYITNYAQNLRLDNLNYNIKSMEKFEVRYQEAQAAANDAFKLKLVSEFVPGVEKINQESIEVEKDFYKISLIVNLTLVFTNVLVTVASIRFMNRREIV